jgi:hypothetical protein
MKNPYKLHLDVLFNRIIELRHTSSLVNTTLTNSIKDVEEIKTYFFSRSALVISDWTGRTENGWEINYHTGIRKYTFKENYRFEVERIVSQECCYAFAQSFEAIEKFFKDCVRTKIQRVEEYKKHLRSEIGDDFLSENLPGGDKLFNLVKKAGDSTFSTFSENNNNKLKFKELWTVLSESRHAITHSKSIIKIAKIKKSDYHFSIFNKFFWFSDNDNLTISIGLDYDRLVKLLDNLSEFAFQVFKSISLNENLVWEISKE